MNEFETVQDERQSNETSCESVPIQVLGSWVLVTPSRFEGPSD